MPRKLKVIKPVEETVVETEPIVEETVKTVKPQRKPNAWLIHVAAVKVENPAIAYKDVLKLAKDSYTRK